MMHGPSSNGFRNSQLITERLWATFASAAINKITAATGMTGPELAENIGCCAQTVLNARDMKANGQRIGQLEGRTFINLMRVDPMAIESLLQHFGRRSVPIEAKCTTDDPLPDVAKAVHSLAVAQSPKSPAGQEINRRELLNMLPDLEAAQEAISHLIVRARKLAA